MLVQFIVCEPRPNLFLITIPELRKVVRLKSSLLKVRNELMDQCKTKNIDVVKFSASDKCFRFPDPTSVFAPTLNIVLWILHCCISTKFSYMKKTFNQKPKIIQNWLADCTWTRICGCAHARRKDVSCSPGNILNCFGLFCLFCLFVFFWKLVN